MPYQLESRTFFPVLTLRAVGGRQHEEEPLCRYTSKGLTDTSSHSRGAKPVFPVKCKTMQRHWNGGSHWPLNWVFLASFSWFEELCTKHNDESDGTLLGNVLGCSELLYVFKGERRGNMIIFP